MLRRCRAFDVYATPKTMGKCICISTGENMYVVSGDLTSLSSVGYSLVVGRIIPESAYYYKLPKIVVGR